MPILRDQKHDALHLPAIVRTEPRTNTLDLPPELLHNTCRESQGNIESIRALI